MLAKISGWWARQWQGTIPSIKFEVSIPYCQRNEFITRGETAGSYSELIRKAIEHAQPELDNVKVRCVSNPNWRK
jgi:hypothetical protein